MNKVNWYKWKSLGDICQPANGKPTIFYIFGFYEHLLKIKNEAEYMKKIMHGIVIDFKSERKISR